MVITDDQKTWLNSVQSNEPYDLVRYVFFQPYQGARLVHFAKGVITIKPTSNYYYENTYNIHNHRVSTSYG